MARTWEVVKQSKKKGRPSKFNDAVRALILRCCYEGMKDYQIALVVNVKPLTIVTWKKNHEDLKAAMERIRAASAKDKIEIGLDRLASGYHEEEVTTETIELNEETGIPVKIKRTKKYYPPSTKAIEMLASKYCPNEYIKKEVKEVNVDIKITQRDRALTLDERLAILNKDKDSGAIEVEFTNKSDKLLESLDKELELNENKQEKLTPHNQEEEVDV